MNRREEKSIEIVIDDDGVHMEAIGFHGKGCHEALTKLQAALGRIKQSKKKPEFYQDKVRAGKNRIKG
jgi:hypothetical protein